MLFIKVLLIDHIILFFSLLNIEFIFVFNPYFIWVMISRKIFLKGWISEKRCVCDVCVGGWGWRMCVCVLREEWSCLYNSYFKPSAKYNEIWNEVKKKNFWQLLRTFIFWYWRETNYSCFFSFLLRSLVKWMKKVTWYWEKYKDCLVLKISFFILLISVSSA